MKRIIFSLASIVFLAVGCQEEIADNSINNSTGFTAVMEAFEDVTKTSMTQDRNIVWSIKDYLSIFEGRTAPNKYRVSDETAGTTLGTFNRIGDVNNTSTVISGAPNIAFYPHNDSLSCSKNNSTFQINNIVVTPVQSYVPGSFGNTSFPMAAVTGSLEDKVLKFRNVMGAMRLQFTGTETIRSIKIEGNNGEVLAGTASVNVSSTNVPSIIFTSNAHKTVTLDCGAGVQLKEDAATSFIISLPPVNLSKGFKVTVATTSGINRVIKTNESNEVERSYILSMPSLKLDNTKLETSWLSRKTFTESQKDIANPERGFYAGYSAKAISNEVEDSNLEALSAFTIQQQRLQNMTIFYTGYYPTKYMQSDISEGFLTLIRTNMKTLRENGAKCILRFAYKEDHKEEYKPFDPEPQIVLRHIQQIKPILQEYGDVILCFQAGFIGSWGEWYYTSHFELDDTKSPESYLGRKEIIDAMLDALPQDRSVALRTPVFTRMMYAESFTDTLTVNTAYNGSPRSRLCCFNDCFGASDDDSGTFNMYSWVVRLAR